MVSEGSHAGVLTFCMLDCSAAAAIWIATMIDELPHRQHIERPLGYSRPQPLRACLVTLRNAIMLKPERALYVAGQRVAFDQR